MDAIKDSCLNWYIINTINNAKRNIIKGNIHYSKFIALVYLILLKNPEKNAAKHINEIYIKNIIYLKFFLFSSFSYLSPNTINKNSIEIINVNIITQIDYI